MIIKSNYATHSPQYIPIIPFTEQELKSMFGLTVEQALAKGYKVVGYTSATRRAKTREVKTN